MTLKRGNLLWEGSRMMLPEHKEKWLEHRTETNAVKAYSVPPKGKIIEHFITSRMIVSDDEMALIRLHILLEFVVATLEHDARIIRSTGAKAAEVYATYMIGPILQQAYIDVSETRKTMRAARIKINELKPRDKIVGRWEYWVRGYRHEWTWRWEHVRAEVEVYLSVRLHVE